MPQQLRYETLTNPGRDDNRLDPGTVTVSGGRWSVIANDLTALGTETLSNIILEELNS